MQPTADANRERIRRALVEVVAELGYVETTLVAVLERAGVDRDGFEQSYVDLDACFVEVWERHTREFLECTGSAYAAADSWREGMRAAAWSYCRFLQDDRERARFLIELSFANELVQASRDFVMSSYAELVHLGRLEREEVADLPRERAEGIVGAIWERIATYVLADEFDAFPAQVPQLMYLMVLPYLGPEAAREELRRGPADIASFEHGEL